MAYQKISKGIQKLLGLCTAIVLSNCFLCPTVFSTTIIISYSGRTSYPLLYSLGGIITTDDLGNYTALVKDPVIAVLSNGLKIYGPPPPASGAVLSNIMMILDGYHFSPNDMNNDDSSALLNHRVIEAFKFAYAKRTEMGDDQFVDMSGVIKPSERLPF